MTINGFDPLHANRIVSRRAAFKFAGVSEATWDRIERGGGGPRRVQLSERRVGYRLQDLLAWAAARVVDPA